jgi:CRP-like cAMP-binding protein
MPDPALLVGPLDRVLFFKTLPAFEHLSAGNLAALAAHARETFLPKGSALLESPDVGRAFFVVVDGQVSVARSEQRQRDVGPGESVGLLDLLARSRRPFVATATVDTLAMRLDWEDHVELCEQHFPIVQQYLHYLSQTLVDILEVAPDLDAGAPRGGFAPPAGRSLDVVERFLALRATGVFPVSAPDALAELARHVREVRFDAGEVVWRRGDRAEDFLAIVQGSLAHWCRADGTGVPVEAVQTIGMYEALYQGDRLSDLTAATPVTALRIGVQAVLDIMEDHFDMAMDFLALHAAEVLRLEKARQSS